MKQVQKPRKPLIVYYLIAIAVLILFNSFVFPAIVGGNVEEVDYGTFLTMVENKEVSKVQLEGESIYFTDKSEDSRQYETTRFDDPDLVNRLEKAGCKFGRVADRQMSPFLSMLLSIVIPMIIFILLGQFLSRQLMKKMGGAAVGNQFMQFGKSNAKVYVQSTTGITFNDVAGEDEAKELLTEIVDFLHNPGKYSGIGAKLPKGALLVGPPGTGKTLLLYDTVRKLPKELSKCIIHFGRRTPNIDILQNTISNTTIITSKEFVNEDNIKDYDYVLVDETQRMHDDQFEWLK